MVDQGKASQELNRFPYIRKKLPSTAILFAIWFLGTLCDRLWFALDNSVPSWDQADYLTGTLNYLEALQNARIFDGEWWQGFWLLSSKIPPFTYVITGLLQGTIGTGFDQAAVINLFFNAVLLGSVYGLGKILFSESVGLWAAALCQIMPAIYRYRLDFLLDFPQTAVVTLTFFCLTGLYFYGSQQRKISQIFRWTIPLGLSFGVALMVKQTALIFLLIPGLWVITTSLIKRRWGRLFQLTFSVGISTLIWGWWYRTNWLIILTSGKRATVDSAIAEGDAPLNTLAAWTFYFQQLPYQISLPLLAVPIGILLFWLFSKGKLRNSAKENNQLNTQIPVKKSLRWLFIFILGAYLLSSLNPNKDDRYVLPYLPIISILLSYGFTRIQSLWAQRLRWGTFALATILMLVNLFPIGGLPGNLLAQTLSPKIQHHPYQGQPYPHREVIDKIISTEPYLRSTLGILPSTPQVNQHNLNYYGALKDFQVYGRQVGTREKFVPQDTRSLSWFLTKTSNQGSIPKAQAQIVDSVENSDRFNLSQTWKLPDNSSIKLYHQKVPPIEVQEINQENINKQNINKQEVTKVISQVNLNQVNVPQTVPPGLPVPVTYQWKGSAKALKEGLVLITWKNIEDGGLFWLHDHSIGMGNLHSSFAGKSGIFQVTERMAMLPPKDIVPGTYEIQATYLNRTTEETYPIQVPKVNLIIDNQAKAITVPELDLVTQIRTLGATMSQGVKALEKVFDEVGRINQYDPNQDYLNQAEETLKYRLKNLSDAKSGKSKLDKSNLNNSKLDNFNNQLDKINQKNWSYTLALINILQRHIDDAIESLQKVTKIDSNNPYSHAYLAFVQLYNFQPKAAEKSLKPALESNKYQAGIPLEIKALDGISALMQGNLIKAWRVISSLDLF